MCVVFVACKNTSFSPITYLKKIKSIKLLFCTNSSGCKKSVNFALPLGRENINFASSIRNLYEKTGKNKMRTEKTKIQLEGIRLYGFHGISKEEQSVGSWFEINVSLEVNVTEEALVSDNIAGTVDYSDVLNVIRGVFAASSRLLEHLAYGIAQKLCDSFDTIDAVCIQVRKLAPPVPANVGCSAVELTVKA